MNPATVGGAAAYARLFGRLEGAGVGLALGFVVGVTVAGCGEPDGELVLEPVPETTGEACARLTSAFCDGQLEVCGAAMDVTLYGLCYAHHFGACCEDDGTCALPYGVEVTPEELAACGDAIAECGCALDDRVGTEACIGAVACVP